jgi:hypothetical protein
MVGSPKMMSMVERNWEIAPRVCPSAVFREPYNWSVSGQTSIELMRVHSDSNSGGNVRGARKVPCPVAWFMVLRELSLAW